MRSIGALGSILAQKDFSLPSQNLRRLEVTQARFRREHASEGWLVLIVKHSNRSCKTPKGISMAISVCRNIARIAQEFAMGKIIKISFQ